MIFIKLSISFYDDEIYFMTLRNKKDRGVLYEICLQPKNPKRGSQQRIARSLQPHQPTGAGGNPARLRLKFACTDGVQPGAWNYQIN